MRDKLLPMNEDLRQQLVVLEYDHLQKVQQLEDKNTQLQRELTELYRKIDELSLEIDQWEREQITAEQARAMLKKSIKVLLKEKGLYTLAFLLLKPVRVIYRWLRGKEKEEKSISSPTTVASESGSGEALSQISDDAPPTEKLLRRWAGSLKNLLCLKPTASSLPLLQILQASGVEVICLGGEGREKELRSLGMKISRFDLGAWLTRSAARVSVPYDGILIESEEISYALPLLKGRLKAQTKVFFSGEPQDLPDWGTADDEVDLLRVYASPPSTWQALETIDYSYWPWRAIASVFPATLPSGRPWPKISVITVTLNQGIYLEETIRSVLLQGYPNLEYIVLDGGSTDNTSVLLDRYGSELSYCVSEKDGGQSNALNKGFRKATGDILAWLNSDDCYLPGALWRVAMAFDTYGSDMIVGGCELIRDSNLVPFRTHHTSLPIGDRVPLPLDRLLDIDGAWYEGNFFQQPEVFWTRQLWERSGGCVEEQLYWSMDYELWVRFAYHQAQIVHIPDTLVRYRVHPKQKTAVGHEIFYVEHREARDRFLQKVGSSNS